MTKHLVYNRGEMWPGFDPEIQRDLAAGKTLASLCRQKPTREWPLIFVEEHNALLIVREWPGGHMTAHWTSILRDISGPNDR